jgi:MFS family permease
MLAVLRQRNFALVWFAGLISLTGDWFLMVARPLVVYELTGSVAATALAAASRLLPQLLLGSVAGVFVDRWDRRRTMLICNLLLGCGLLPLVLVRSADWLWILYLQSIVQSILAQFLRPAENAFLPRLVREAELVPANALNGLNNNLARLVGPPLGGLAVAAWGLTGAALIDAASFFVAAGMLALIKIDGRAVRSAASDLLPDHVAARAWTTMWRDLATGLTLVRRNRLIAVIFLFWAVSGIGEGLFSALFAPFVTTVLHGGSVAFGTIVAAQAVGGLVGSVAIGHLGKGISPGKLLGLGAIGLGAIDLCTINAHRVAPGILLPVICMVIVGIPGAGIDVGATTLIQTGISDEYRGRIFGAIGAMGALSMLAGTALAGALGDRLGIVTLLNVEGALFIAAGFAVLAVVASAATAKLAGRADPVPEAGHPAGSSG